MPHRRRISSVRFVAGVFMALLHARGAEYPTVFIRLPQGVEAASGDAQSLD